MDRRQEATVQIAALTRLWRLVVVVVDRIRGLVDAPVGPVVAVVVVFQRRSAVWALRVKGMMVPMA